MSRYIENINPERLLWCLQSAEITPEDWGKVKPEKLKNGHLTYNQLKEFAQYFGFSILFFLEQGIPNDESVHSLEFRTLKNQEIPFDVKTAKIIKRIERTRENYLSVLEELGESFAFNPPVLSGDIKKKANTVRKWLKLDDLPSATFDTYRNAVEAKNILLFQSVGYNGKWKIHNDLFMGLSIYYETAPIIFVRKVNSEQRKVFTLFHELAHILLHKQSKIDDKNNLGLTNREKEQEANRFASLCLLPDSALDKINIPTDPKKFDFQDIQNKYGISAEVILLRLLDANRITHKFYKQYITFRDKQYAERNKEIVKSNAPIPRTYRHREPIHIYGKRYTARILEGLEAGKVTLNKASNYLDGIKISDISKLTEVILTNPSHSLSLSQGNVDASNE